MRIRGAASVPLGLPPPEQASAKCHLLRGQPSIPAGEGCEAARLSRPLPSPPSRLAAGSLYPGHWLEKGVTPRRQVRISGRGRGERRERR